MSVILNIDARGAANPQLTRNRPSGLRAVKATLMKWAQG